ncbi:DUF2283 domain-containing protein [Candidatus Halobeggiatoa sp. HSG11]|nr:DUF2283 domain-containing protein [Candidatus Halobeggiatoa sp. HSG11]
MQIDYDEQEDILLINFNNQPIIKDISLNWNVNIGMTEKGIGEISILEAKASGLLPLYVQPNMWIQQPAKEKIFS